jgi:hypothetical protein
LESRAWSQLFREEIADTLHSWVDCAATALYQNTPLHMIADMIQQGRSLAR